MTALETRFPAKDARSTAPGRVRRGATRPEAERCRGKLGRRCAAGPGGDHDAHARGTARVGGSIPRAVSYIISTLRKNSRFPEIGFTL